MSEVVFDEMRRGRLTAEEARAILVDGARRQTAKTLRSRSAQDGDIARAFGEGLYGVEIGIPSLERAITVLDALAYGLAGKGLQIEPTGRHIRIVSGQEKAEFSLKEVTRTVPHEPTEAELAEEARRQKRRERYWRGEIAWAIHFRDMLALKRISFEQGSCFFRSTAMVMASAGNGLTAKLRQWRPSFRPSCRASRF
ncbi:hypothetical protein JH26_08190 [Microvirga sp. BSC39]|nr:hypothetical protein [Microvirga sp. BSC39]KFG69834.1 hypothetical protein JH26_08190 [Microvirga sp. BSC39]